LAVNLVFETHATTTDNEAGIATGWLPGQLSEDGRRQARELGTRRRQDQIDLVFCSDLARAEQTARIAFGESAIPVLHDWRLRECNYGDLNGAPVTAVDQLRSRHIDAPFPNGQSYRDVVELMRYFISDLVHAWDGTRVCVVSHKANKWALDVLLLGRRLDDLAVGPFDWREGWEYTVPRF
jgi:broad specificity phosphatase PhoE